MSQRTEETAVTPRKAMSLEDAGVPQDIAAQARMMVQSGYFPTVRNVAQAATKIMLGRDLGATAIESIQYVHIWEHDGRTSIQIGYVLIGQLIQRSGKYTYRVVNSDEKECAIDFFQLKPGGEAAKIGTSRYTLERAQRAGLTGKAVWKQHPETMLFARALSTGAKWYCPEVLGGAGVSEEPYIEAQARVVEPPPVVEEPPEGEADPWAAFWPEASRHGFDHAGAHAFFGLNDMSEGALKAWAEEQAAAKNVTLAEQVVSMTEQLKELRAQAPEPEDIPFE